MPGWPVPEGQKCITISLPTELVTHLDDRSTHLCCSRAAYLRQLIVLDRERQAGKA
jgi:metal-responsive CopG/Arc/MetJ family transcriptional regulator